MKLSFALLAAIALVGCATSTDLPRPAHEISVSFDFEAAKRMLQDGTNAVKGNAFMRQQGGGVITCAGQTVYLIPATAYATQRVQALYNSTERGINTSGRTFTFNPDPPEYKTSTRTSRCDSQGNFAFDRVADGDFFLNTTVTWNVGYSPQGGHLMHRVALRGGQSLSIVMAP